jgi:hypothetical protein
MAFIRIKRIWIINLDLVVKISIDDYILKFYFSTADEWGNLSQSFAFVNHEEALEIFDSILKGI